MLDSLFCFAHTLRSRRPAWSTDVQSKQEKRMRMGRLIARLPFERTAISPPGPNSTARWPGRCRAIAADDQQGPGFSIARGWPAGCYPEQATKEGGDRDVQVRTAPAFDCFACRSERHRQRRFQ